MTVTDVVALKIPSVPRMLDVTRDYVDKICAACDAFQRWERENIIEKEPSAEVSAQYRDALKMMLRVMKVLDALISDPDYPDSSVREKLEFELWRLNDSWTALNNPVSDAEAEQLLKQVFPGDPFVKKVFPDEVRA